jgi:hypothetical protein
MPLSTKQIRFFHDEGYLVAENLIPPADLESVIQEMIGRDRYSLEVMTSGPHNCTAKSAMRGCEMRLNMARRLVRAGGSVSSRQSKAPCTDEPDSNFSKRSC